MRKTRAPKGTLTNEEKGMSKLDNLTIGEAKELAAMFGSSSQRRPMYDDMVDDYVIVRSRNEGINAGYVVRADETGIILRSARRIWYHRPKSPSLSWYEGVAVSGVSNDSKLSCPVPQKAIVENYSVTVCTHEAQVSIVEAAAHEQN